MEVCLSFLCRQLSVYHLTGFAVNFYGKERSVQANLPVKTDQDTLREGYRYFHLVSLYVLIVFCVCNIAICASRTYFVLKH